MATFVAIVHARRERDRTLAAAARDRAWHAARAAADMLCARFGATRVVAFESLAEHEGRFFGTRSDIDLAARGIAGEDYFLAVAALQTVFPELRIDLVAMESCPEHLRSAAERTGVEM